MSAASMDKDPMQEQIKVFFKDNLLAFNFLCKYIEYIHLIDDVVDEEKKVEDILKMTQKAFEVFNHDYWLKWRQSLLIVERLIHNAYKDSIVWENDSIWKRRDAKVLNQRGYDMLFAIILIEFGEDKLNEFSLLFREYSHRNQGHHEL